MKKLILVLAMLTGAAHAFDLSLVGTVNFESPTMTISGVPAAPSGSSGLGYGGLLQFDVGEAMALETGALVIKRKYTFGVDSLSFSRVQIPAVLRFTGLPIISFGAGPYVEFAMGDITKETLGVTREVTYALQNFDSTTFGVLVSVGANFPVAPMISVLADLRYNLSFTDYDNSSFPPTDRKFGGFQFLAGLKLSL